MAHGRSTAKVKGKFSDSIMVKLSDDILHNIFLKLSVKSILRCRSVCKAWRQLLFDPIFVRMHINQHRKSQEKLLLGSYLNSFYSLDYCEETVGKAALRDFPLEVKFHVMILGSCNGLLCIGYDFSEDGPYLNIILWNPTTGDYKILPHYNPSIDDFDYSIANGRLGLGYCGNDYEIVRITNEQRVHIYTLKTNSWKTIKSSVDRKIFSDIRIVPATAFNGYIYWYAPSYRKILGFDLKNEKFVELPFPGEFKYYFSIYFTVVEGCLGVVNNLGQAGDIEVWRMKELADNKKEWVKMMNFSSPSKSLCSLCWLENGKMLFQKLGEPKKLYVYDLKRNTHFPIDLIDGIRGWVTYSETLVSPNAL